MIEAELPDGTVLEFPDGTPDEVIQGAVKQQLGVEEVVPTSAPEESVPTVEEIFDLDPGIKERSVFVPTAIDSEGKTVAAPSDIMLEVMNAVALPGRILQGHVPTNEELFNFTAVTVGGTIRGALQGLRKVAGRAAPEGGQEAAEAALRAPTETGVPLTDPTIKELETGARQARFDEQGIPATAGDLTQDFAQQADESRLVSMAGGKEAEPLRQLKLRQSEAFVGKVNELVDSLGVPQNTGDTVKDALSGRIDLLRADKSRLYKEVADAAPEITNAPILTDEIVKVIPDAKTTRRLRTLAPNSVKAVDDVLVEFGLDTSKEAVESFIKSGGEVTPLTLGNFDDFRIALGQIDRSDTTGAVKVITGPIRQALDEEAAFIDNAVRESGITDQSVVNTLKEARERVRTLKTEFSPQSITGRLTSVKRDGVTPVVEASKVSNELLRPAAPIENLQRTLKSLGTSGKGKAAIGDLQASVVMDALEAALKAPSRKTSGIETVGGNQFAKALDRFGDDKLDLLFKDNPKALKSLRDLKQTGLDITPTAGAVPRGSAPVILDLVNRADGIFSLPGLAAARDVIKFVKDAGADERAVRKALESANPVIRRSLRTINLKYPNLAAKMGVLLTEPFKQLETLSDLEDTA